MRKFLDYVKEAVKVHSSMKERFVKSLFVIVLACSSFSLFMPLDAQVTETGISIEPLSLVLNLLMVLLTGLAGIIYLKAYLDRTASAGAVLMDVLKKLPLILLSMLVFYTGTLVGALFFLVIPGLIFYTASQFYICRQLEMRESLIKSFTGSWVITYGHRLRIFFYVAGFALMLYAAAAVLSSLAEWVYILISGNSSGENLGYFVQFFILSLGNLMQRRFQGAIYLDIRNPGQKAG